MPYRFDSLDRAQTICNGVIVLLARGGIEAVTLRALAVETGFPPGSLLHHLDSRDRILQVATHLVGERMAAPSFHLRLDDATRLLPYDEESLALTRSWLALEVLGRTHAGVGVTWERHDAAESVTLEQVLGVTAEVMPAMKAQLHGLRAAICRPIDPMSGELARDILTATAAALSAAVDQAA